MNYKLMPVVAMIASAMSVMANDSITTHIDLQILNRPDTKRVILLDGGADVRFGQSLSSDVVDGLCSFDYTSEYPREMQIIFDDELRKGNWKLKRFYAEGDTVRGVIDGAMSDFDGCFSSSGPMHLMADSLAKEWDNASGCQLAELFRRADDLASGNNDEAIEQNALAIEAVLSVQDSLRCDYLLSSRPTLYGLMLMRRQFNYEPMMRDADAVMARLEAKFDAEYEDFASHPYYEECKLKFVTRRFTPGRPYEANYVIHALDGQEVKMSELIEGRPAIIDLWASWCGPCRIKSKLLIPIYEKYSPKGLAFIAVAREMEQTESMTAAMAKDGYPWQSYVDLDDKDGVWMKNGCDNSGGRILLIAPDGKIVAVNPSASQVELYLKEFYGE